MTVALEKLRSFFSRNNSAPLWRPLQGFFSPPRVTPLEGFLLRAFFALVVAYTLRFDVPFATQPHPAGLARFFDLTWLSDPGHYLFFRGVLGMLLLLYVGGVILPLTLPLLAVGHVLVFTLYNSQGYTHHGFQIVSLTLVAQAATVLYYTVLVGLRWRPPDARLNAWLLWQSQMIVVGTYLISVFSKMINSRGLWLWNSSYIALDLIKTRRQLYYGGLDPEYAGNPPEATWLLENPWIARGLFSTGFLLEAVAFLALASRKIGFLIGVGLILMHRSIAGLMGLRFDNNEMLCAIYLVGLPFLVAWCLERIADPAVRVGVLAGALAGVPLSYFAQPSSVRSVTSLPGYLFELIKTLRVWHDGQVADFLRFTLPMILACLVMAGVGALVAGAINRYRKAHRSRG
jgi:hypothetical protein